MRSSRIQTLFLSGGRLAPNKESEALKALVQGSQSIGASIQMIPAHIPQSPGFSNQGSDIVARCRDRSFNHLLSLATTMSPNLLLRGIHSPNAGDKGLLQITYKRDTLALSLDPNY